MPLWGLFRRTRRLPAIKTGELTPRGQDARAEEEQQWQRRYLQDVPYALPKDEAEIDRLNFQHYALMSVQKQHIIAPLDDYPRAILDVGCGTGLWAREVGQRYPLCQVVGVDVEPPERLPTVPANVDYVYGDVLKGLPLPENSFDLVHQRLLILAVPASAWPQVLRELLRLVRPGGWLQLTEAGMYFNHPGPRSAHLRDLVNRAIAGWGFDPLIALNMPTLLTQAGAIAVEKRTYGVMMGEAGGQGGRLLEKDMLAVMSALTERVASFMPVEEWRELLASLPEEWRNYGTEFQFHVTIGRKPRP